MLAQVDPLALAPYLAGPGAATLVLLIVGAAVYRLVISHLLPLAAHAIDRHLKQIDALIDSQKTEAQHTAKALSSLMLSSICIWIYLPIADFTTPVIDKFCLWLG